MKQTFFMSYCKKRRNSVENKILTKVNKVLSLNFSIVLPRWPFENSETKNILYLHITNLLVVKLVWV